MGYQPTAVSSLGRNANGSEFQFPVTNLIPPPPDSLSPYGKQKWYEVAAIMIGRDGWSSDWLPALDPLCRQFELLEGIDNVIRQAEADGTFCLMTPSSGREGNMRVNPILDYRLKATALLQNMMAHFGLTPLSCKGCFQSQLSPSKKPDEVDTSRPKVLGFDEAV